MNLKNSLSFLNKIWPENKAAEDNNVLCFRRASPSGLGRPFLSQYSVNNLRDVEQLITKEVRTIQYPEVYMALATFRYNRKPYGKCERKSVQAYFFRTLAFDIDAGENKPYKDYIEANDKLKEVMNRLGIEYYLSVKSGYGIHCYILLEETIKKALWIELSTTLANKLQYLGLQYDRSKIKDPSMILRVVSTYNMKMAEPIEVQVIQDTNYRYASYLLDEIFSRIPDPKEEVIEYRLPGRPKEKMLSGDCDSEKIKAECNQVKLCAQNSNVDEPLWFAILGVASVCNNNEEVAKEWSKNYDEYSEIETIKKLHQYQKNTTGPSTCNRFIELNPMGCKGCPHMGNITSPAQLGVLLKANNPFVPFDIEIGSEVAGSEESIFVPSPYFINKLGSICREIEGEIQTISQYPLYISQIAILEHNRNPISFVTLKYKLPFKKWMNLELEVGLLTSASIRGETLGGKLMNAGFYVDSKDIKKIQSYIIHSLNARQSIEAPDKVIDHYGWTPDGTFILGNIEYGENTNIVGVAKNSSLVKMSSIYSPTGDINQWINLSKMLLLPDTEYHAFTLFLGFASPLMEMTNIGGCVVNLYSDDTGIGKSTCGLWALSIYGDPLKAKVEVKDTENSFFTTLGLLNNIPLYIDDVSSWDGEQVSEFIYMASTGQEKARCTREAELKTRNQWSSIIMTSSNPSLNDLLDQHTTISQGQKARLFEIPFNKCPEFISVASKLILAISQNYGVAGEIYIKELIRRYALRELQTTVQNIREQYQAQFNFYFLDAERFIFTTIGTAWLGARIAKEIGLIHEDIDLKRIFEAINKLVLSNRRVNVQVKESAIEAINQFLTQHHKNFVKVRAVIDSRIEKPSGTCPNESLFGRIQLLYPNTVYTMAQKGYISISIEEFKKFCKNSGRAYIRYETELGLMPSFRKHKVVLSSGISHTLSGADSPQMPIPCLSFEIPSELLETYNLKTNEENLYGKK